MINIVKLPNSALKPDKLHATYTDRPFVPGCAGCAMAHPDFGRSVNPISTKVDILDTNNYYWHTRISDLSTALESRIQSKNKF